MTPAHCSIKQPQWINLGFFKAPASNQWHLFSFEPQILIGVIMRLYLCEKPSQGKVNRPGFSRH
ncbi:hypothetical protein, partial [Pseudomonas koreensis]